MCSSNIVTFINPSVNEAWGAIYVLSLYWEEHVEVSESFLYLPFFFHWLLSCFRSNSDLRRKRWYFDRLVVRVYSNQTLLTNACQNLWHVQRWWVVCFCNVNSALGFIMSISSPRNCKCFASPSPDPQGRECLMPYPYVSTHCPIL